MKRSVPRAENRVPRSAVAALKPSAGPSAASSAEASPRDRTRAFAAIAVLTIAQLASVLLVFPRGPVPQNDDWAYATAVLSWIETGTLVPVLWNDPTFLLQAAWGALFSLLLGPGYDSLRISAVVLSWVGILALYGILRKAGASRAAAVLGAGVFLFHPVRMMLARSFNTDAPYVALALLAVLAFLRARETGTMRAHLLAGMGAAAAFGIRQQGLPLAIAAGAWIVARGGRRRWALAVAAAAPALLASGVLSIVQGLQEGAAPGAAWSSLHPFFRGEDDLGPFLQAVLRAVSTTVLNIGPFLLPLVPLVSIGRPRRRFVAASVLIAAAAGAATWWTGLEQQPRSRGFPFDDNYLTRSGALPPYGPGSWPPGREIWQVVTWMNPLVLGWVGAAGLRALFGFRRVSARPAGSIATAARFVLVLSLAQWLPTLLLRTAYGRYALVLLPAFIAAALAGVRPRRSALAASALLLVTIGAASLDWTRASLDRARAHWEVASELRDSGWAPEEIQTSFEWEGMHLFRTAVDSLGIRPPFDLDQGYPWTPLLRYRVRVFEGPPVAAQAPARRYLLPWTREERVVTARIPPR